MLFLPRLSLSIGWGVTVIMAITNDYTFAKKLWLGPR